MDKIPSDKVNRVFTFGKAVFYIYNEAENEVENERYLNENIKKMTLFDIKREQVQFLPPVCEKFNKFNKFSRICGVCDGFVDIDCKKCDCGRYICSECTKRFPEFVLNTHWKLGYKCVKCGKSVCPNCVEFCEKCFPNDLTPGYCPDCYENDFKLCGCPDQ